MTAFVSLVALGCTASKPPPLPPLPPQQVIVSSPSGPNFTVADIEAGYQRLFTYTDMQDRPLRRDEHARLTAVVFFATWCRPCRHELGWLGDLRRDESYLQIIGINYFDESGPAGDNVVRSFLDTHAPWLQAVRADQPLFQALGGPRFIPSMYLFDSNGHLLRAYIPPARKPPTEAELRADIRRFMVNAARQTRLSPQRSP